MLFTGLGRSVLGKTVPSVSSTTLGLQPRAVLQTSGTVFPNTASQPVNNIIYHASGKWDFSSYMNTTRECCLTILYHAIENTMGDIVASQLVYSTPDTGHHWFTDTRISSGLMAQAHMQAYIENTVGNTIKAT